MADHSFAINELWVTLDGCRAELRLRQDPDPRIPVLMVRIDALVAAMRGLGASEETIAYESFQAAA